MTLSLESRCSGGKSGVQCVNRLGMLRRTKCEIFFSSDILILDAYVQRVQDIFFFNSLSASCIHFLLPLRKSCPENRFIRWPHGHRV